MADPAPARRDLPLLDPLRLLASVAIVRHHVRGDLLFGVGFGLPLFLLILFALAAGSRRVESLQGFARRKGSELLLPWLRWSALYLVFLFAVDLVRGDPFSDRLHAKMIYSGGDPSFWFLPFAAVALVPVELARRLLRGRDPLRVALAAALLGAAWTQFVAWSLTLDLPDQPVRAWLRVSPALFFGVALAQSRRVDGRPWRLLLPVAALALASFFLSPFAADPEDLPRRFAVAVPLACLGFAVRPRVPRFVRRASTVTFGVYLVHPLLGKSLFKLLDLAAWPAFAHTALVWSASAAAVLLLRRLPIEWTELRKRGAGTHRAVPTPAVRRAA